MAAASDVTRKPMLPERLTCCCDVQHDPPDAWPAWPLRSLRATSWCRLRCRRFPDAKTRCACAAALVPSVAPDPVEWQKAPDLDGGTLILDQGDFLDGSMLIKTPPHATVRFTLIGRDLMGPDIEITLPESRADASGNAIVVADDSSFEALRNSIDPSHSVSARVTVNDGYNSRTNHTLWRDTSDVRVNLSTPPSMTRFRENGAIELVEDTFYANQDNDTNTFPAGNRGDSDGITGKSQIRVTLTQSLRQDERLEFAVANSTDKEGNPVYGAWKQATKLSNAINIAGSKYVSYSAEGVTEANGMNWVKARVVLVGGQYTGGVGIRLLYAVETNNANSTPSVAITYEKASVKAGDRLALYEGDRLLASKTLVAADVGGSGSATQTLTVAESLSAGDHQLVARFIGASGKTSQAAALNVSISDALKPELSNLKVASASAGATPVDLVQPGGRYASVSDFGAQGNGIYDKGLIFSGKVGTPGLATDDQKYLVTVSMGGKVLAFDIFNAGDFALTGVGGALAPGFYKDLSLTVTNVTTRPDNSPAANSGVTASVKDLSLGWYWAAQAMGDITGGHGNDGIILSPTAAGTRPAIQTGAGSDTLILGLFNKSQNYSASVTDFQLGVDKLAVFGRTLTAANFGDFARSVGHFSDGDGGTRLDIDLNGDTAGGVYSVYLQKLPYSPANLQTIFGI